MKQDETTATRERAAIYNTDRDPLTLEGLRQRLKHIAGLCWGLSIDLNNEVARNEQLMAENKLLKEKLRNHNRDGRRAKAEKKMEAMTPEERERYERRLEQKRYAMEIRRKQKAIEAWRRENDN